MLGDKTMNENILNEMKVVFPAKSCNEALARMTAAAAASQLDPSAAELIDIKTAVSEAVTNCIVHAYRDTEGIGKVEMLFRILSGNILYIRIKDSGCGIKDIKQAMEPLFTTAPQEERAGLGFAVMESFMDTVKVTSTPGKGTSVVMTKKIAARTLYASRTSKCFELPQPCIPDGEEKDENYR